MKYETCQKTNTICAVKYVAINDLLLEGESAVFVRVEESDEAVGLRFRDGVVALVAEVVEDLERRDSLVAVSVKSLEGRVRGEVADVTEALTGAFQGHLTAANGNKEFLKSTFGFKSKAHDSIPTCGKTIRTQVRCCQVRWP